MVSVHLSSAERASKGEDRCACNVFHHREVAFHVVTVCDGHGGDRAACVCVELLPRELKRAVVAGDGVEAACRRAFAAARDALRGEASGCAAAVVVLSAGRVTTGNVGDVEAVLVPVNGGPVTLTANHALHASTEERNRVRAAGATLAPSHTDEGRVAGPLRMWPGGLAMGRALGDADCPHVLSEPAVSTLELFGPATLVVGSDGLWDALPRPRLVALAAARRSPSKIVESAWGRRSADDITCAVAEIDLPERRTLFGRTYSNSSVSSLDSTSDGGEDGGGDAPERVTVRVPLAA